MPDDPCPLCSAGASTRRVLLAIPGEALDWSTCLFSIECSERWARGVSERADEDGRDDLAAKLRGCESGLAHGGDAIRALIQTRARLAEVEAERDAARGIAPDDGRTHTLLLHLTPALLARVEALGYAPGVTPAGVLPWLVDALEEAREEIEVLRSQNTSYWSDLVACREQVEKDRAAILRLTEERDAAHAALEELRLALAAEQGKFEGLPFSSPPHLKAAVNAERIRQGLSWRELAAQIDVSSSGFTRWNAGRDLSVPAYLKVCDWLRAAMLAADKATT